MHLCNFLVLVKRKKTPLYLVCVFPPRPCLSILLSFKTWNFPKIIHDLQVNWSQQVFNIHIDLATSQPLLSPPSPAKNGKFGTMDPNVGGWGRVVLWHIWPIFVENHGKCPKSDEISEIEGVGGWVHKFGSIVPNLPIFWYGIDPIYQSQRMFTSSSVQLYN